MPQIFIQPSQLVTTADVPPGQWVRGIPTPGIPGASSVGGVADCRNLIAPSPPTLLEQYDLYSYSIGWGVIAEGNPIGGFTTPPNLTVELAVLVNERVSYATTDTVATTIDPTATAYALATGLFSSDLVNPISLGARDRLGLRIGASLDQEANLGITIYVAAQVYSPTANPSPVESTLSYTTKQLPARRRL